MWLKHDMEPEIPNSVQMLKISLITPIYEIFWFHVFYIESILSV